jgi:hypothetical protein
MERRDEMLTMDHDGDISRFVCQSFYLSALCNTLKDVTFFSTGICCEIVVVDMCNCINAWSEADIIEILFLLSSNKENYTYCIFLIDMKVMFLVDRVVSQVCKKTQTSVLQNDVIGVYREYVKESFIGLSII